MRDDGGIDRYKQGEVRSIDPLFTDKHNRRSNKSYFSFVIILVGVVAFIVLAMILSDVKMEDLADKIVSAVIGGGPFYQDDGQQTTAENDSGDVDENEKITEAEITESMIVPDSGEEKPLFIINDISKLELGEGYVINETNMMLDIAKMINSGFNGAGPRPDGAPLVLIVHTNATEKYIDYEYYKSDSIVSGLQGVASVGDAISARLNNIGIPTVYCGAIHGAGDLDAETETAETILTMLKIYPSIRYVLNIGRLQLSDDGDTPIKTSSASSNSSAQISISVSRWGNGDGREDNMALALRIRRLLNEGGERVCAPVRLTEEQGNSALSRYYLKIDIGSEGNSTNEAIMAGERLACAIAKALN